MHSSRTLVTSIAIALTAVITTQWRNNRLGVVPKGGMLARAHIPQSTTPQLFDATGRLLTITAQRQGRDAILDLSPYPSGLFVIRAADRSFTIIQSEQRNLLAAHHPMET